MNHRFQRADLKALMGGVELLDGKELSCGFVRIEADGFYSTYEPEWGEEPLFDMSFNPGQPVLPFPFTLEQFKAFCAWHHVFKWEVIDLEFTNSFCSWHPLFRGKASDSFNWPPDDDALLELKGRNQASAVLVLSILEITDANEYLNVCKLREFNGQSEAETMVEVAANEKLELPAPPVVAAEASCGIEPDKAGLLPVEQGLSTKDIAIAFDGVNGWSFERWRKNLSASKWLHPARIALGGAGGAASVWSPVMLAQLMHDDAKGKQEKEKLMKVFNSRFTLNPVLGLWREAFNEYFATHCAAD